ncbi:MAG: hypothetical protein JWQ25_3042 [Daejeonella sp.]|nr:hypothetical protein [Daejeonella sp.]
MIAAFSLNVNAQTSSKAKPAQLKNTQPFLFSVNTITQENAAWSINYAGSYGDKTTNPFAFNGVDQHLAIKGYLGSRFTLFANAGLGFNRSGGTRSTQQLEIIRDFIGGKNALGFRMGAGLGAIREWTNSKAIFSRVVAEYDSKAWKMGGNMRFEKSFDAARDKIDLISSIGIHRRVSESFFGGLEAVGEDLEGFWDEEEAEGGAKLFIGPSINYVPSNSKLAFSLSGGPIIYATKNETLVSSAPRNLNQTAGSGYTIKFQMTFNLK